MTDEASSKDFQRAAGSTRKGPGDGFVRKVEAQQRPIAGQKVLSGGGKGDDSGWAIAVDNSGKPYVTGRTDSKDGLSVLAPEPQQRISGLRTAYNGGWSDVFVARGSVTNAAIESAGYIGGDGEEEPGGIWARGNSRVIVVGSSDSGTLKLGNGAFSPGFAEFNVFLANLWGMIPLP